MSTGLQPGFLRGLSAAWPGSSAGWLPSVSGPVPEAFRPPTLSYQCEMLKLSQRISTSLDARWQSETMLILTSWFHPFSPRCIVKTRKCFSLKKQQSRLPDLGLVGLRTSFRAVTFCSSAPPASLGWVPPCDAGAPSHGP